MQKDYDSEAFKKDKEVEVLRSNGTIEKWDKSKILNSLIKETNISKDAATIVTREVEKLIKTMDLPIVPAPLIRELVNAKLIEYGLTEVRKYYTRVGVPVFDAYNIMVNESSPKKSSEVLARHIKREFSLVRLYSKAIVEAYHRKIIHINGVEMPDGFFAVSMDLDKLKKGGVRIPDLKITLKPAKRLKTFINQVLVYSEITKYHTVSFIYWNDFNYVIAPFAKNEGLKSEDLRDLAQTILFELYTREIPVTIVLSTQAPTTPAIGPEGKDLGDYEEFDDIALEFAKLFLEEFSLGDRLGGYFDKYIRVVIKGNPRESLLWYDYFFYGETMLPHKEKPVRKSYAITEEVTLNLYKLAEEANVDEERFLELVRTYEDVALDAILEKESFLNAINIKNTIPDVESWERYRALSLYGLREAIMSITGEDPMKDKSSFKLLEKTLQEITSSNNALLINYKCPKTSIERLETTKKVEKDLLEEASPTFEYLTEGLSFIRALNIFKKLQKYFDLDVYLETPLEVSYEILTKVAMSGIPGISFTKRRWKHED